MGIHVLYLVKYYNDQKAAMIAKSEMRDRAECIARPSPILGAVRLLNTVATANGIWSISTRCRIRRACRKFTFDRLVRPREGMQGDSSNGYGCFHWIVRSCEQNGDQIRPSG